MNRFWLGLLAAVLLIGEVAAQEPATFKFIYVYRKADPAYEPHKSYTGLVLRDRHRPLDGAQTALRDSRVLGRALGVSFELVEQEIPAGESAPATISRTAVWSGPAAFLLDLPLEEVAAAGQQLAGEGHLILFNIRHREDSLRGENCSAVLFHTIPSESMLSDALAQYLQKRGWPGVLMLTGPEPADEAAAAAFRASVKKFSLSVRDERRFVLGNDPRQREQSNVALLTGGAGYDVVYLADTVGEFGRYVPFATYLPRPTVGSEGLASSAWDWTWERNGAPQLNQRFDRIAKRRMTDEDWAAWAAVRAVVEAITRTNVTEPAKLRDYFRSADLNLDLYKGIPGSFRPWDNQLRQPILLHTHNAVIAWAPLEGFLHERNVLDTLGRDEPETACRLNH